MVSRLTGRHPRAIETTSPTFARRHARTLAVALLVLSAASAVWALWLVRTGAEGTRLLSAPGATVSQLLCFGSVGAVLVVRRPDLPFGWLLGLAALADVVLVGVGTTSLTLATGGRTGELVMWGVATGAVQWIPDAVPGLINVRFPSGRPAGVLGTWLDRAMRFAVPVALVGGLLGDTVTSKVDGGDRAIDGTWVTPLADATTALLPLVILLGVLAGVGVVVRCLRATGIERKQLQWRASGAAVALLGFPLAVAEVLPAWFFVIDPVVFSATLLIPVLRYQLWSGDPVPRRRTVGLLVSRRTLLEAREEERRRMRRDLHDGIGPLLSGLRLNLDAVQMQLSRDPDKAREYLDHARAASAEAITDLRELVYALRPPAIDELGLVGAVRARCAVLSERAPVAVTVEGDPQLGLPAAVEVALYLCATEAVANVVRHSTARRCRVVVAASGSEVRLTVDDDGTVEAPWHPGVGLSSMRERATELGGRFRAGSGPDGFHVQADYPRRSL